MNSRTTIVLGMLLMAIAIALGVFGGHALKDTLMASGRTETFELALSYLVYHALALILLGFLMEKFPGLRTASILLVVGIVFFCGSLLAIALADESAFGAAAPIGGTALIVGWLTAAWSVYKSKM